MEARVIVVTRAISLRELGDLDSRATIIALTSAALASFDRRLLERFTTRSSMAVAIETAAPSPAALAAALLSDYFALAADVQLDHPLFRKPDVLTGLSRRLGRRIVPLIALETPLAGSMAAPRAHQLGICDALVEPRHDPLHWLNLWIGPRSVVALAAAARLIRSGRSEVGERIEFSRLFAIGEPQAGLRQFLAKQKPDFSSGVIVEKI